MGIEDRDWYRDEMQKRKATSISRKTTTNPNINAKTFWSIKAFGWTPATVLIVLLATVLVAIARDMKNRGVPLSWHGIKWWLSLWF